MMRWLNSLTQVWHCPHCTDDACYSHVCFCSSIILSSGNGLSHHYGEVYLSSCHNPVQPSLWVTLSNHTASCENKPEPTTSTNTELLKCNCFWLKRKKKNVLNRIGCLGMPSWAQGLLLLLSIFSSSFLPLLAAGVIACSIRRPREGKCVSLNCLWACPWGISDHQCVFHQNEPCNWVCEVVAHESWHPPNLEATAGQSGRKLHLPYSFGWALARCRSLWGALISLIAYYPWKKWHERERLSVWKSLRERIPNLPKSLANPVSSFSNPIFSQCELQERDGHNCRCIREHWNPILGKELWWWTNDGQLLS